jgi:hypothetical protein
MRKEAGTEKMRNVVPGGVANRPGGTMAPSKGEFVVRYGCRAGDRPGRDGRAGGPFGFEAGNWAFTEGDQLMDLTRLRPCIELYGC